MHVYVDVFDIACRRLLNLIVTCMLILYLNACGLSLDKWKYKSIASLC